MERKSSGKLIYFPTRRKRNMDRKKVLIVEDEMDMRIFLTTLLDTSGYKPIIALNGEEGEKKALSERPDLILLDIMMPKEGGVRLYRKLKTNPSLSSIPVLVISAISKKTFIHSQKTIDSYKGEAIPEPEGYIEKPPDPDELLQEIERILS
jgi:CheY-like chemotaxis protein